MNIQMTSRLTQTLSKVDNRAVVNQLLNDMLQRSDWTQGGDAPITAAKRTEWREYRKTLRDIKARLDDPDFDPAEVKNLLLTRPEK